MVGMTNKFVIMSVGPDPILVEHVNISRWRMIQ
jgi:hypothetical protein